MRRAGQKGRPKVAATSSTRRSAWLQASKRQILVNCGITSLALLYWFPVRRWFARAGTAPEEIARAMPGDSLIADPTHTASQAITVDAPPADIWPWLVQLGYQRGGLYSYDWLDRLFGFLDRPSADDILPEFQHLAVGDTIRLGPREKLTVAHLEPERTLALRYDAHDMEWIWQFGLYPLDANRTRLVSRGTERIPDSVGAAIGMIAMEPAAYIMTRRMLIGLKARAEARRQSRAQMAADKLEGCTAFAPGKPMAAEIGAEPVAIAS